MNALASTSTKATRAPALVEDLIPRKIRIAFLIRSLEVGGAETQMVALARGLDRTKFSPTVFCFYPVGPLMTTLRDAGIEVISLDKKGRWDTFSFFRRLVAEMRGVQPEVIHSFMGPPNLLAIALKRWLPNVRVVWGIRSSDVDLSRYDYTWKLTFALERWLSKRADIIAANSFAGRDHMRGHGFVDRQVIVVPNGINVSRFKFDNAARLRVRSEWKIRPHEVLIGLVGRLDPMKDHASFLHAAKILSADFPNVRFACIGGDGLEDRERLLRMGQSLGIAERVIWTGQRDDIPEVLSALEIHSSASISEGFPNAVAEAMAVGTPCVATDVGDSARIVGNTGVIVPPRNPEALAQGWNDLLRLPGERRRELSDRARQRIVENFSLDAMIERMSQIYTGQLAVEPKTTN